MIAEILDSTDEHPTQLETIRSFMLSASERGRWLTLAEIAEFTEFGEASISAQLRHLRKACHGGYRVEKRPRRILRAPENEDGRPGIILWEYRVFAPRSRDSPQAREQAPAPEAAREQSQTPECRLLFPEPDAGELPCGAAEPSSSNCDPSQQSSCDQLEGRHAEARD